MNKTKKIILIIAASITSGVALAVSGLFATFAIVGKKIDEAYKKDEDHQN